MLIFVIIMVLVRKLANFFLLIVLLGKKARDPILGRIFRVHVASCLRILAHVEIINIEWILFL